MAKRLSRQSSNKTSVSNRQHDDTTHIFLNSKPEHADRQVLYNLLQTVWLKPLSASDREPPQYEESKVGTTNNQPDHRQFQPVSVSLRSMRERRRNGAKNSRGPAFIFGKNGANQPKNDIELLFLEAAEYGNIPTVRRMLEDTSDLDVNCTDFIGQNALQLATGNEHLEVVESLLNQPKIKRIGDALMLAISKGMFGKKGVCPVRVNLGLIWVRVRVYL